MYMCAYGLFVNLNLNLDKELFFSPKNEFLTGFATLYCNAYLMYVCMYV